MTKVMKKALALVLALTMVFSTVIVSNAAAKKTNNVTVNGVATTKKLTVKKGKTIKLTTGVTKCTVKSSKKSVVSAKVSKKTVTLKAKKVGTSKITISKKGYKNVVVTVKVTKKAPTALKKNSKKAIPTTKSLKKGATWTVTANQKVKAVSSKKTVATVKVSAKKFTVTAKKAGSATITVYNKTNAAVAKKIKVTVTAAATSVPSNDPVVIAPTVNEAGDSVYTLPALDTIKTVSVKTKSGVTIDLTEAEVAEITTAVAAGKVEEKLAEKTATAGATVTLGGKTATVKAAYDATTKAAVLTYAGKDYTVSANNANGTLTVNGLTATYDASNNTLTVPKNNKIDTVSYVAK